MEHPPPDAAELSPLERCEVAAAMVTMYAGSRYGLDAKHVVIETLDETPMVFIQCWRIWQPNYQWFSSIPSCVDYWWKHSAFGKSIRRQRGEPEFLP